MIGRVKRRSFISVTVAGSIGTIAGRLATLDAVSVVPAARKILIAGGGFGTAFIRYMAELTGKPRPTGAKVYYVNRVDGKAVERVMEPEMIS